MIKKLSLMALTLLVLLVIAGMVIPYFIPDSMFKNAVIQKVETMTGRVMTIGGRLRVKLFPVAGVYMENVTLTNPPHYRDLVPVMTLQSMDIQVAVIPLLAGNIEIKKLDLEDPHINLHVSDSGVQNWLLRPENHPTAPDNYYPATRPRAHTGSQTTADVNAGSFVPPVPGNLLLSDIHIRHGAVTYVNDANKSRWEIRNLDTDLSLQGLQSPFSVNASGEWNGKTVKVKGTLSTLQSLLDNQRTQAEADIGSDFGSLVIDGFVERNSYIGKIAAKSSSLKDFIGWASPSAKPSGMSAPLAMRLGSDVNCTPQSCNLTNVSLSLDAIEAKGNVKVVFDKETPQFTIDLTTNTLNLNPFLSAARDNGNGLFVSDAVAETGGHWSDEPMNLAALKTVNVTAGIKADGLVFHHFTIGKTSLRASLQHDKLAVDVVDADMYEGKGNVSLILDAGTATPVLQNTMFLKGVQVAPLLKDAANIDNVTGTADIQISAGGNGRSERDIISSLSGNGKFKLDNGTIKGVSLIDIMHRVSGGSSGGTTPINQMDGTFTIHQGIVNNKDLVMAMPGLSVGGQGDINLPAYSINYRLAPQMIRGQGATAQQGISVPVLVVGSLDNPKVEPDVKGVIENAIQNPDQFKQQLKNSKGGLKDQLKGLKGLLKGN